MTTMTLDNNATPAGRLEELVDRLLAALFREEPEQPDATNKLVRTVHEARRLRQSSDPVSSTGQALDRALAVLASVEVAQATDAQARRLYAEWLDIARRRFAGGAALLYSPDTGKAAVLIPRDVGTLEVAATLGMRWPVGKLVSRRSLRGLKPLSKACPRTRPGGGASWS